MSDDRDEHAPPHSARARRPEGGPDERPLDDLGDFTIEIADQVESFCVAVREIAAAEDPDYAISLLLLEISQLLLAGGRLGAISDVVPDERFEPDAGFDPDVEGIARRRWPTCSSRSTSTPRCSTPTPTSPSCSPRRLSDDITDVMSDLLHGLQHYRAGRADARRCGGGSSPTCPTGARPRPRRCGRCTRWSPTCGWTPRWTTPIRVEDRLLAETVAEVHKPLTAECALRKSTTYGRRSVLPEACAPRKCRLACYTWSTATAAHGSDARPYAGYARAPGAPAGRPVRVPDCPARGRVRP